MIGPDLRLEPARQVVERVLAGDLTDDDSALFQDDVVLICVRIVEKHDPKWLMAKLADSTLPLAGRLQVVRDLSRCFSEGLALLRSEQPSLAPDLGGKRFTS